MTTWPGGLLSDRCRSVTLKVLRWCWGKTSCAGIALFQRAIAANFHKCFQCFQMIQANHAQCFFKGLTYVNPKTPLADDNTGHIFQLRFEAPRRPLIFYTKGLVGAGAAKMGPTMSALW